MISVLLVDDESGFLELAKNYLEKQDKELEIETTSSSKKALKLIKENEFDCIVSDYQMPSINGIELLKKVKNEFRLDLPFIIFTGKGREEIAMKALNNGANRYLKKGKDPKSQFGVLSEAIVQEHKRWSYEKRTEKKLKRERFYKIFSNANDAIYLNELTEEGLPGKFLEVNDMGLEIFGFSRDELLDMTPEDLISSEEIEEFSEVIKELPEKGDLRFEATVKAKDGSEIPVGVHSQIFELEGKERVLSIARDITERKQMEKDLLRTKEKYRSYVENAPNGVFVANREGDYIEVNKKASEMTGYSKEELLEKNLIDLIPSEAQKKALKTFKEALETGKIKVELPYLRKDGSKGYWIVNVIKLEDKILGFTEDITKRKEAEERFKKLFNAGPDPIFLLDKNGFFKEINQAALDKLGYEKREIKEKNLSNALFLPPESKEKVNKNFKKDLQGEEFLPYTIEVETKDGDQIFAEVNTALLEGKEEPEIIAIARDITEKREFKNREEFLHSLLRHDVQNKNQVIQGYLQLVEDYELPEEVKNKLSKAKKATKEGIDIIEKVGTLRNIEKEKEIKEVNLKPILKEVVDKSKEKAKRIDIKCQNCRCKARGGGLLKELFSNLVENSIKHSKGDQIKITSKEKQNECIITIEDDGKGIPDEQKTKIFDKGYKDEDTGGSGMGLYLVKRIIEQYNGKIEVKDSELGGARFDITLKKS